MLKPGVELKVNDIGGWPALYRPSLSCDLESTGELDIDKDLD